MPADMLKTEAELRNAVIDRLIAASLSDSAPAREATVERAGWLERQWTRLCARFELSELYEVSFTPGRLS